MGGSPGLRSARALVRSKAVGRRERATGVALVGLVAALAVEHR